MHTTHPSKTMHCRHTPFTPISSTSNVAVTPKTPPTIYTYRSPAWNGDVTRKLIEGTHSPYPTKTHTHDRHHTPTSWTTHSPRLNLTNTSHVNLTHTAHMSNGHMAKHPPKAYRHALHKNEIRHKHTGRHHPCTTQLHRQDTHREPKMSQDTKHAYHQEIPEMEHTIPRRVTPYL